MFSNSLLIHINTNKLLYDMIIIFVLYFCLALLIAERGLVSDINNEFILVTFNLIPLRVILHFRQSFRP